MTLHKYIIIVDSELGEEELDEAMEFYEGLIGDALSLPPSDPSTLSYIYAKLVLSETIEEQTKWLRTMAIHSNRLAYEGKQHAANTETMEKSTEG